MTRHQLKQTHENHNTLSFVYACMQQKLQIYVKNCWIYIPDMKSFILVYRMCKEMDIWLPWQPEKWKNLIYWTSRVLHHKIKWRNLYVKRFFRSWGKFFLTTLYFMHIQIASKLNIIWLQINAPKTVLSPTIINITTPGSFISSLTAGQFIHSARKEKA